MFDNFSFSMRELKEISIAWFLISLALSIALIWRGQPPILTTFFSSVFVQSLLISLITVGVAFIFHEMGHKFVAQKMGYWAEFRMNLKMLLLALFFAYAGGFVFAAPGAVRIFGKNISLEENAKISITGPLVNLFSGFFIFLPMTYLSGFLGKIGFYGVVINFFLAAFNLLPFGVFDGKKIYRWNKLIYLVLLGAALIGVFFSFGFL